jgi:hypothetical protein
MNDKYRPEKSMAPLIRMLKTFICAYRDMNCQADLSTANDRQWSHLQDVLAQQSKILKMI